MSAIYIILLCVGSALVCAMVRTQRPEIATMISLAVGLGALLLTGQMISRDLLASIGTLFDFASGQTEILSTVLKAAGIAILGELGVQICTDAGESALAGRIGLACRIVMLGMAVPLIVQIIDSPLFAAG